MHPGWRRLKFWVGATTLAPLLAVLAWCAVLALGPDRDLVFTREVPSEVPLETLDESLRRVPVWPKWHFDVHESRAIDGLGRPFAWRDQMVLPGMDVRWTMMPKKRESRRYELQLYVVAYRPRRLLQLRVMKDTTGRLTRLFEYLEWTVEIGERAPGTFVRGTLRARTANWRSRVMGGLAERVFLSQVLQADLFALAGLKRPVSSDLLGPSRQ
jgi:hypothetical protein